MHAGQVTKCCFSSECTSFSTVLSWIIWYSLCWQRGSMNYCCRLPQTRNASSWVWEATVFLLLLHKSLGVLTTQSGLTGEWHLPDTLFFAAIPLQHALQLLSFKPEINCYKWLNTAEEQWIRRKNWAAQRCSKFPTRKKFLFYPQPEVYIPQGETPCLWFLSFSYLF